MNGLFYIYTPGDGNEDGQMVPYTNLDEAKAVARHHALEMKNAGFKDTRAQVLEYGTANFVWGTDAD